MERYSIPSIKPRDSQPRGQILAMKGFPINDQLTKCWLIDVVRWQSVVSQLDLVFRNYHASFRAFGVDLEKFLGQWRDEKIRDVEFLV